MINQSLTSLKAKGEVNTIVNQWITPQDQAEIAKLEHFIFLLMAILSV